MYEYVLVPNFLLVYYLNLQIKRSNDNTYKVEKMGYMKDHTCLGSDNK